MIYKISLKTCCLYILYVIYYTVVGDTINIMKTTFELNFDFYQAFKQNEYTKTLTKEKLSIKKASL